MIEPATPKGSKRPLIIAAAVLAAWLVLAGAAGPFATKLG